MWAVINCLNCGSVKPGVNRPFFVSPACLLRVSLRLWGGWIYSEISVHFKHEQFKIFGINGEQKEKPNDFPFGLWCGKQDLNLHEIAFTRT